MQINNNTVVELHYTLSEDGKTIETSKEGEPMTLLVGHKNMLAAVEEAMIGKTTGDTLSITLEPEQAYGQRREDSIQRIPLKHLQGAKKWKPGMVAVVDSNQGRKQVTVVKVGRFNVDCDINHPLAGKTVHFDLEILSVREAEAAEISHGHVHGKGGVHH